jgi:hypothetical protein
MLDIDLPKSVINVGGDTLPVEVVAFPCAVH